MAQEPALVAHPLQSAGTPQLPPPVGAAVHGAQAVHATPVCPQAAFCDPAAHVESLSQHPVQLDGPQLG
jgi:hypothetical protein